MQPRKLELGDALLIIDVQNDFCPGGALPVPHGGAVVRVLNEWLAAAESTGAPVFVSRDWHPPNHCSFRAQGGPWPRHCVQNSPGAEFHPDLRLPQHIEIISKASTAERENYSDFEETDLAEELRRRGVRRLWVGGLALDYCVRATVVDACRAGFETHVILEATRAINREPGDDQRAIDEMRKAGAVIEDSSGSPP